PGFRRAGVLRPGQPAVLTQQPHNPPGSPTWPHRGVLPMSDLILHAGARRVCRAELDSIAAPEPTETWFPLSHGDVMARVEDTVEAAGFNVRRADYALSRGNHRFFGTCDLETQIAEGVTLSIGVRNSTDKSNAEVTVMWT